MYDFWPPLLGLFAAGAIPVTLLMRWRGVGTRRADWGLSTVLFGWFLASAGVAVLLYSGYYFYETLLACQDPSNGIGCSIGWVLFLVSLLASLVPVGIGALLLGRAPRR